MSKQADLYAAALKAADAFDELLLENGVVTKRQRAAERALNRLRRVLADQGSKGAGSSTLLQDRLR